MPEVSVVIPTCNRPGHLKRALASALGQTFTDIEVIVVDDGMADRAEQTVEEAADRRVRYIPHQFSRGAAAARNTGVRAAGGAYIAFLNDTDEWLPEKLEKQVEALARAHPKIGMVVTNVIAGKGTMPSVPSGSGEFDGHELALRSFKSFPPSSQLFRSEVFGNVGYFDESLPSHQEADMAIRVTEKYKLFMVPDELVRIMPVSESPDEWKKNQELRIRGREILLAKHEHRYRDFPEFYGAHYFTLAQWCRETGQSEKARRYYLKALGFRRDPRYILYWLLA